MSASELASADLQQLVASGHLVQECENSADLARHAHQVLQRLIGADVVVWNELTVDGKVATGMTFPDLGESFWADIAPGMLAHIHEHPFVQHLHTTKASQFTAAISDLLPTQRFVETGLYRNGYREFSARYQISSATDTTGGAHLVLSLNRHASDFSTRDKTILECVAQQTKNAYRNLRRLDSLSNQLRSLALRRHEADSTWLYIDTRFIITWGDPELRPFLRHHFGHDTANLFLPAALTGPVLQRWHHWDANRVACENRTATLHLEHAHREYQLFLDCQRGGIYRLIVVALRPGKRVGEAMAVDENLSRREREVAYWVSQGKTNPEIGIILGISSRTVEKHVHAALDKVGVVNRVQLARLSDYQ
jgi:DNA-binding CsgD family transcriptional regulator